MGIFDFDGYFVQHAQVTLPQALEPPFRIRTQHHAASCVVEHDGKAVEAEVDLSRLLPDQFILHAEQGWRGDQFRGITGWSKLAGFGKDKLVDNNTKLCWQIQKTKWLLLVCFNESVDVILLKPGTFDGDTAFLGLSL